MRRPWKPAFAVATLLALASSSVVGWAVAFHLAADDHHVGGSSDHADVADLVMVLHGHPHDEDTPVHGHPLLTSASVPLPGKPHLSAGVMVGDAPEVVVAVAPGRRPLSMSGPTHDPPPRREAASVLRI